MNANTKIDEYSADRWLRKRGGVPKSHGVGYTQDVRFDKTKVRTNATEARNAQMQEELGPDQGHHSYSSATLLLRSCFTGIMGIRLNCRVRVLLFIKGFSHA